ncbi:MAG TPA: transglycosylase domain-containing protein, partial [Lentimicrobium sp.]|nr:transglycosylase domain-containing protein [Lentimicrobium sp.]
MKKAGSIFLLILLVLLGTIIYLNTNIRNDKYVLNQDLITQVKENVPQYTTLDKIPPNFTKAIVAVEDHRFYKHHGFDMQS